MASSLLYSGNTQAAKSAASIPAIQSWAVGGFCVVVSKSVLVNARESLATNILGIGTSACFSGASNANVKLQLQVFRDVGTDGPVITPGLRVGATSNQGRACYIVSCSQWVAFAGQMMNTGHLDYGFFDAETGTGIQNIFNGTFIQNEYVVPSFSTITDNGILTVGGTFNAEPGPPVGEIDSVTLWSGGVGTRTVTQASYQPVEGDANVLVHFGMDEGSGTTVADSIGGPSLDLINGLGWSPTGIRDGWAATASLPIPSLMFHLLST
jgi:hypothetical protein